MGNNVFNKVPDPPEWKVKHTDLLEKNVNYCLNVLYKQGYKKEISYTSPSGKYSYIKMISVGPYIFHRVLIVEKETQTVKKILNMKEIIGLEIEL